MKRLLIFSLICIAALAQHNPNTGRWHGDPGMLITYRVNETVTGTIQYRLVTSNLDTPPKVLVASVGTSNLLGICIADCGTSGNARIATQGPVLCEFDGPTTSRNIIVPSDTVDGKCHDLGTSIDGAWPSKGRLVGVSLTTSGTAGTFLINMFPTGTRGAIQTPSSSTGKILRDDGQWVNDQTGSGTTPTGTGYRHTTAGVEDAASALPTWTEVQSKPATFPPDAHTHAETEVVNLVTDLAAKAPLTHTHSGADVISVVATATALAVNGTNCSGGQAAAGTDAGGNAEGCFTPSGGGVAHREFHICSGTCVALTNLGAGPTEMGSQASRSNIDLSGFTDARVVTNLSVTATTGDFQIECGDTTAFSPVTDLLQWDNPAANVLIVGVWAAIPAGCKTAGGVYVRVVGLAGNGVEDPAFRFIKLQVR